MSIPLAPHPWEVLLTAVPYINQLRTEVAEAQLAVANLRDNHRSQLQAKDERLARLVEAAHELANDHGWCETFDEFCREHGLPAREREYTVYVDVSFQVSVSVTATNDEEAWDQVDTSDVRDAVEQYARYSLSTSDYCIENAEES